MAFQVSPGVLVTEKDLTNVIPAVSTTSGGIVLNAEKGPIGEITTISSEKELVDNFGKPTSSNFEEWFTAANFLGYGNNLKVVRPVVTGIVNAVSTGSAPLIKNTSDYSDNYLTASGAGTVTDIGPWVAREAGTLGNSLRISMCTNSTAFGPQGTGAAGTGAVNDASAAIGDTTVTVDDGGLFQVGDLVEFGDTSVFTAAPSGYYYKITGISLNVLTIARFNPASGTTETGGLRHAVVDNALIRRRWEYYFNFSSPPTSTADAVASSGSLDEMHIVVSDEDGAITGTAGTILETYEGVSQAYDAKTAEGSSNYYPNVIYAKSKYVFWADHHSTLSDGVAKTTTCDNTGSSAFSVFNTSLASGSLGSAITNAQVATGYEFFNDTENVDLSLLLCGPSQTSADATGDTKATAVMDIATARKDCVAFFSPARADVVDVSNTLSQTLNVKGFADGLPSTSYAVIDSGYKYMFDKYNDVYRYVPLNGDTAGVCARTDAVADPWFSPGGFSRGQIRGAVKLAFNPNQTQRDDLYKARVNPIVSFPGQGTVLFGDKTAQSKPSAFDRINVRRLFIVLEKAISTAAKFQLFEFNDEFSRANFRNLVEPFLRDVQGRRGITDFSVVCDDTNNTGDVIDRNEFRADIFIKPNRSINFIQLNFIATRSGVAFSEVAGA